MSPKRVQIMEALSHPSLTTIARIGILHAPKIVEAQNAKPNHVQMLQVSHSITLIVRIGYQLAQLIQVLLLASKKLVRIPPASVHGHIVIVKCGSLSVN